ncbi:MAG: M23 family metallopeptidase [Lachnospiraceae bacterium]
MRRQRDGLRKEKIIMLSASLFVLSALTMTGVYVKEKNESENDGYVVDLSAIEKQASDKAEAVKQAKEQAEEQAMQSGDLDNDPSYQEVNSGKVSNLAEDSIQIPGVGNVQINQNKESAPMQNAARSDQAADETEPEGKTDNEAVESSATTESLVTYQFDDAGTLQWPIVGNVLLNYSMDKTTYFASLDVYKYNPALIIAATVGEPITAAAEGEISSIYTDEEIGGAVSMNLGDGYELTYGQLDNIQVGTGQNVHVGDIIGYVAKPSKYYSVEGSNVYFKLTQDGKAVNPLNRLQ